MLDHEWFCEQAEKEISTFAAVVADAPDIAVDVPTCPGWTVGGLAQHTGTIHRWATTIVDTRAASRIPLPEAESPFGGPIGHGFLTLSLFIPMWSQVLEVTGVKMAVNYGLNKVRFPAPVPVGAKIRLTATLVDVEEVKGGLQLTVGGVIEREGSDKPVCVLESLSRLFG